MKHKLLVAPLLSIIFLLIFSYPLRTSDLKSHIGPSASSLAASGEAVTSLRTHKLHIKKETPATVNSVNAQEVRKPAVDSKGSIEEEQLPELEQFIATLSLKKTNHLLRGVHVTGTLALMVEQQPSTNGVYVSTHLGTATQFKSAADNGVVGLLAHNYLSGGLFFNLKLGQEVHLIYGDGQLKDYRVSEIGRFQKLDPSSLHSDLIEMSTGKRFTTNQVFNRYYTGSDHVTFQTCLAGGGISNWGLVFIVANPSP